MPFQFPPLDSLLPAPGDVVKVVGGGVVGWFSKLWKDRSKRRKMRHSLYRELAQNYGIFCQVMKNPGSLTDYPTWRDYPVQTKYYDYALKDMDTLHSVVDYGYLSSLLDEIGLTRGLRGQALSYRIWNIKEGITAGLLDGFLDKRLLYSYMAEEHERLAEEEITRLKLRRAAAHPASSPSE